MSPKGANPQQKPWHPASQLCAGFPGLWKGRLCGHSVTLSVTDSLLGHTDLHLGRALASQWGGGAGGDKKGEKGMWRRDPPESLPQMWLTCLCRSIGAPTPDCASELPENLFKIKRSKPHLSPPNSKLPGVGPKHLHFERVILTSTRV